VTVSKLGAAKGGEIRFLAALIIDSSVTCGTCGAIAMLNSLYFRLDSFDFSNIGGGVAHPGCLAAHLPRKQLIWVTERVPAGAWMCSSIGLVCFRTACIQNLFMYGFCILA
jgi:hypothetical protein